MIFNLIGKLPDSISEVNALQIELDDNSFWKSII